MAQGGHEELDEVNDTIAGSENIADLATNIPLYDMEYANKELEAAKKDHEKLLKEKIALIEVLNCRKSKFQVKSNGPIEFQYVYLKRDSNFPPQAVIDETNQIQNRRDDMQEDIDAVHEKLRLENEAIEDMKLLKQKNLAESKSLEEYHKHQNHLIKHNYYCNELK